MSKVIMLSWSPRDYFAAKTKEKNNEDKKDYQGKRIAFLMRINVNLITTVII